MDVRLVLSLWLLGLVAGQGQFPPPPGQFPPSPGAPEAFPRQDPAGFPLFPQDPNKPNLLPNQFGPQNQPFDPNSSFQPNLPWDRAYDRNPYENNVIINEA